MLSIEIGENTIALCGLTQEIPIDSGVLNQRAYTLTLCFTVKEIESSIARWNANFVIIPPHIKRLIQIIQTTHH